MVPGMGRRRSDQGSYGRQQKAAVRNRDPARRPQLPSYRAPPYTARRRRRARIVRRSSASFHSPAQHDAGRHSAASADRPRAAPTNTLVGRLRCCKHQSQCDHLHGDDERLRQAALLVARHRGQPADQPAGEADRGVVQPLLDHAQPRHRRDHEKDAEADAEPPRIGGQRRRDAEDVAADQRQAPLPVHGAAERDEARALHRDAAGTASIGGRTCSSMAPATPATPDTRAPANTPALRTMNGTVSITFAAPNRLVGIGQVCARGGLW